GIRAAGKHFRSRISRGTRLSRLRPQRGGRHKNSRGRRKMIAHTQGTEYSHKKAQKTQNLCVSCAFLWLIFLCSVPLLLAACTPARQPNSGTPQRIISVVPNVTETLFAFGLGDKVIAVGDYDQFPPEVEKKPRVGGLINPNIEKIIEMHP